MTNKTLTTRKLEIEPGAYHFNEAFLNTQRIGFVIMSLLILAALLGFFGSGFFSQTIKTNADLTITYEKFIRQQASTVINISLNSQCDKESILSLDKTFFKNVSLKSITPTPSKEISTNNSIQYIFLCDNATAGIQIVMVLEPETFGLLRGSMYVNNNQIQLSQFVYP